MDYNQNSASNQSPYQNEYTQHNNYYRQPITPPANSLAVAAMSLGIISLLLAFTCTIYPTLVFGGLAIILALLSKGCDSKMHVNAKTAVITATVGLAFDVIVVIGSFLLIFSPIAVPEYRADFDKMYEQIYGQSFEDMLQDATEGM